jgi:hypothetical protein
MEVRPTRARKSWRPGQGPTGPRTPADFEDRALETALLGLLSSLEFVRTQLEAALAEGQPGQVVETATLLVSQVVAFAEKQFPAADDLTGPLARAGEFLATTAQAQEQLKKRAVKSVWRWFGGTPAVSAEDRERLRQVAAGLDEVLATFFTLFAKQFTGEETAQRWEDTQEVFRTDLKRVFGQLN